MGAKHEHRPSKQPLRFLFVLAGIGLLFSAVVFFDLLSRGTHLYPEPPFWPMAGTDPLRGKEAIERLGCGSCHVIPGVKQARGRVGPQLNDFSNQIYIAGLLANTPDNLVAWLQNPQGINPGTAMPDLGISEEEAMDIAAYLYSLD